MIGYFGSIVFEVSNDKILTFNGLKRDTSSRFEVHELVAQKPRAEYISPGLDTISFTVILNGLFGVKPRDEMNRWLEYARAGNAETLVVGGNPLGVDKWTVQSISQVWETIMQKGILLSGKVEVTLQEYVTTMWTG